MNATECVHRTPHCTHASAHFCRSISCVTQGLDEAQKHSISDHVSFWCSVSSLSSDFFPPTSSTPLTGIRSPLCATAVEWKSWPSGQPDPRHRGRIDQVQKTMYSWWKRKIAKPISKIDDFLNHVFQEHNQEADHLTKMEAEEQKNCRWQVQ